MGVWRTHESSHGHHVLIGGRVLFIKIHSQNKHNAAWIPFLLGVALGRPLGSWTYRQLPVIPPEFSGEVWSSSRIAVASPIERNNAAHRSSPEVPHTDMTKPNRDCGTRIIFHINSKFYKCRYPIREPPSRPLCPQENIHDFPSNHSSPLPGPALWT